MSLQNRRVCAMIDGMKTIVVIGGGAAGMMAAGAAAEHGARAVLIEKNASLGKKLLITGGGRCNVTNTADVADFVGAMVPRNPNFLYSALYSFDSAALRDFLRSYGVETKVEDAGRVFPVSDDAADVLKAFVRYMDGVGVEVLTNTAVAHIVPREISGFIIKFSDGEEIAADAVIIATGGLAAPHTGSTGDGHHFARGLGHDVTKLYPSLVPLVVKNPDISELMGLSLYDVGLVAKRDDKVVYKDSGDVIFTHFGISGPMAIRASAYLAKSLHMPHDFYLDFVPHRPEKGLNDDFLQVLGQNPNRDVKNCLAELLPGRLVAALLAATSTKDDTKARDVTKEARRELCRNTKAFWLEVAGCAGFGAAAITCGGVSCDEIDPSTMESKLVPGLYFAGEVLDVDALTGGYNLAIAFATGRLTGKSAVGNAV